jgi:AcrR family transcriptional regulator
MSTSEPSTTRREELLELAYRYVLERGLTDLSLRPLARAIGSSPRVLLFLFDSKDRLVQALLARARQDEQALIDDLRTVQAASLPAIASRIWEWLAAPEHRGLLVLWTESYARSLVAPTGTWRGFATTTVTDWLELLADSQPADQRTTPAGEAQRTLVLAILRGALLDLLATGDQRRTTAAVQLAISQTQATTNQPQSPALS